MGAAIRQRFASGGTLTASSSPRLSETHWRRSRGVGYIGRQWFRRPPTAWKSAPGKCLLSTHCGHSKAQAKL